MCSYWWTANKGPQGGAPHRMRAAARPAAARPLLARPPAALPCVPRRWLLPAAPAMQCNAAAEYKSNGKLL